MSILKQLQAVLILLVLMGGTVSAQDGSAFGSRYFHTTITLNAKPLLAPSMFEDSAGHFIVKGAALTEVIARAYGVEAYQVVDAPDWAHDEHLYDIEAVPPPAELVVSDTPRMLQALLADSFGLQVRREVRELALLVLAFDAARQQELALEAERIGTTVQQREPRPARQAAAPPAYPRSITTRALLPGLARQLREPIHDLTGRADLYLAENIAALPPADADPVQHLGTVLARSGLILERRLLPLEVIVVSGIERPVLTPAADR